MPSPDLCSEDEVSELVHTFYRRVRDDAALGPIFERHVQGWLALFHETTGALRNQAMRERANDLAGRVAESLWYGYRLSRRADPLPRAL